MSTLFRTGHIIGVIRSLTAWNGNQSQVRKPALLVTLYSLCELV